MEITFNELPSAVSQLLVKLGNIEALLSDSLKLQHPVQPEADPLLNISQAGQYLNLAKPTIYSLVGRKEIPVMKRGNKLYFSKQELTKWVKDGRLKTKSEIDTEADKFLSNRRKGAKQ
jgi:excisionase family DNA binding protein